MVGLARYRSARPSGRTFAQFWPHYSEVALSEVELQLIESLARWLRQGRLQCLHLRPTIGRPCFSRAPQNWGRPFLPPCERISPRRRQQSVAWSKCNRWA